MSSEQPNIVVEFIIYIMTLNTIWFIGLGVWELLKDLFNKKDDDPYDF